MIFALLNGAAYAAVYFIIAVHKLNTSVSKFIIYKSKTGLDFTALIVCAHKPRAILGILSAFYFQRFIRRRAE